MLWLHKLYLTESDCISIGTNIYGTFMPLLHKYLPSAHVTDSEGSGSHPSISRFQTFFPVWLREALGARTRALLGGAAALRGEGLAGEAEAAEVGGRLSGVVLGAATRSPRSSWGRQGRGPRGRGPVYVLT